MRWKGEMRDDDGGVARERSDGGKKVMVVWRGNERRDGGG